jgi:CheY-like chemotaxis protein
MHLLADDISADKSSGSQQPKDYYSYTILHKVTSFFHNSSSTTNNLQYQKPDTATVKEKQKEAKAPFLKRILIVDDEPDVTLTFKVGKKRRFEVHSYNSPLETLSEFKPNFYDLMLADVYMPNMNGFQLYEKILESDVNIRVCFISAAELNIEALRELYLDIKCLAERLLVEID